MRIGLKLGGLVPFLNFVKIDLPRVKTLTRFIDEYGSMQILFEIEGSENDAISSWRLLRHVQEGQLPSRSQTGNLHRAHRLGPKFHFPQRSEMAGRTHVEIVEEFFAGIGALFSMAGDVFAQGNHYPMRPNLKGHQRNTQ